jgi:tRNA A58 N-methylase Trm61
VVSHKDIISRPPRSIINTHNGKRTFVHFISRVSLGLKLPRSAYVIMIQSIGTNI